MNDNEIDSGWKGLLGWMHWQWGRPREPISAEATTVARGRGLRDAQQVETWEDEGGAPAGRAAGVGVSAPEPPAEPKH